MMSVRPEFVDAVLWHFLKHVILCFCMALFFSAWLFLVTRRRSLWLRYTTAEAAFWQRLGLSSPRLIDLSRRFYGGRTFTYVLCFLVAAFFLLMVGNAGLYFYWKHTFQIHASI
jgi:hypothetical protein